MSVAIACADPSPSTLHQKCYSDDQCDAGQFCKKAAGADMGFCEMDEGAGTGSTGADDGATGASAAADTAGTTMMGDATGGGPTTAAVDTGGDQGSTGADGGTGTTGGPSCVVSYADAAFTSVPSSAAGLAIGDLDDDGALDLVVSSSGGGSVASFLGDGKGGLSGPDTTTSIMELGQIAVGAIGDSTVDAVVVDYASAATLRFQGTGDGYFAAMPASGGATFQAIALVDVTGDDTLDLIGISDALTVSVGMVGSEEFDAPLSYSTIIDGLSAVITAADLDDNVTTDIVAASSTDLQIMRNTGGGVFMAQMDTLALPGSATGIATGDFDGDDEADVVVTTGNFGAEGGWVYFGNGDGTLDASPVMLDTATLPQHVAAGDIDGDGDDDVAIVHENGSVGITLSNGDGTFGDQSVMPCGGNTGPVGIVLGELNGDCALDVAALSGNTSTLCLLLSQ